MVPLPKLYDVHFNRLQNILCPQRHPEFVSGYLQNIFSKETQHSMSPSIVGFAPCLRPFILNNVSISAALIEKDTLLTNRDRVSTYRPNARACFQKGDIIKILQESSSLLMSWRLVKALQVINGELKCQVNQSLHS